MQQARVKAAAVHGSPAVSFGPRGRACCFKLDFGEIRVSHAEAMHSCGMLGHVRKALASLGPRLPARERQTLCDPSSRNGWGWPPSRVLHCKSLPAETFS